MKYFCMEITKVICVTVEAEDYPSAIKETMAEFADGEYGQSWEEAEPCFKLLDFGDVE